MNELILDSISLSYQHHKVLSGVYALIKTGDIFGIFGRNGCGKTTLFKWIFGLFPDEKGLLMINKKVIKKKDRWKYIGYLPQHSFLPDEITVEHAINLYYRAGHSLYEDERISKIKKCRIRSLSVGERRYLEFCLIFHLDRPFILLDEPFSKIEPIYVGVIGDKIRQNVKKSGVLSSGKKCNASLNSGILNPRGIIISGHNHRDIRGICTRISIMKNGIIKEIENTDEELINYRYLPER